MAMAFSILFPALMGIGGLMLLVIAVACLFPAFVITGNFLFRLMPARYVQKRSVVTTLFRK
jgi:hypothetical protein